MGGGTDGAKRAGTKTLWNIDHDPEKPEASAIIAKAYRDNWKSPVIERTIQSVVEQIKAQQLFLTRPDILIITWSCRNHSKASPNTESQSDIEGAEAIAWLIKHLDCPSLIFENVVEWKDSISWTKILHPFIKDELNYKISEDNLKKLWLMGVPQSRDRMLVRCDRDRMPDPIPEGEKVATWFECLEEIIPDLETDTPTKSQLREFEKLDPNGSYLFQRVGYNTNATCRDRSREAFTVRACMGDDGKGGTRNKIYTIYHEGSWYNLSPLAIALLQGFRKDIILPPSNKEAIRGIGNAIAPIAITRCIKSLGLC